MKPAGKSKLLARRPPPPQPGQEVVRLEGVSKAFGSKQVLRDVTLSLRHGETTVILGQSGTGKSVLLKTIIGLLRPDAGRVIVMGQDITRMSQADLEPVRLCFGMLFQGGALFDSLSVEHNVGFLLQEHTKAPRDEIRRAVRERLDMVDLESVEQLMPEELSGGMRKRVALARSIIMDPYIILYDEPTTGLDPVTADTINDLIVKMKHELGATGIVVTHDMASASKVADRMIMLHGGRAIIDGSPEELYASDDPRVRSFIHGDASLSAGRSTPPGNGEPS